jgi:hypothetical protein
MTDFIEVYSDALDRTLCQHVVERFEASGQAMRGQTGSGVDTSLKDSYDITISDRPEWQEIDSLLKRAVFERLRDYVRKFHFLLIGPLSLRLHDPATGATRLVSDQNFAALSDEQYTRLLLAVFRSGSINLQKYLAGSGGYPHWHSEIYPRDPHAETLHRALLYTLYLNDVPEGGETEFYYQERKIAPRAGTLLIAPAGFTHTHRGNTPLRCDKYIATSWVLFQRAEALYGPGAP